MTLQDKAKQIWEIYGKAIQNGVNLEVKIDGLCFGFEKLITAIAEQGHNSTNVLFPNKHEGWTIQAVVQDIIGESPESDYYEHTICDEMNPVRQLCNDDEVLKKARKMDRLSNALKGDNVFKYNHNNTVDLYEQAVQHEKQRADKDEKILDDLVEFVTNMDCRSGDDYKDDGYQMASEEVLNKIQSLKDSQ